jgi:hypothetical protein
MMSIGSGPGQGSFWGPRLDDIITCAYWSMSKSDDNYDVIAIAIFVTESRRGRFSHTLQIICKIRLLYFKTHVAVPAANPSDSKLQ